MRDRKQCAAVIGQSVLCGVESVFLDHKKLSDGEARLDLPDAGLDIGAAAARDLDPDRALWPGAGRSGHRRCDGPDVPGLHQGAE